MANDKKKSPPELDTYVSRDHLPDTRHLIPSQAQWAQPREGQTPIEPSLHGILRLQLIDQGTPILVPIKQNILLGRPDPVTGARPDIDFSDLSGYKFGVSRRHAEIHWHHDNLLMLYDLGSSNGTFLNGERLQTNIGYPLYNGDIIHLGEMGIYVYYEIQTNESFIPIRTPDDTP